VESNIKMLEEARQGYDMKNTLSKEAAVIHQQWEEIATKPQEWLQDIEGQLVFVAGGGLPLTFGSPDSEIWRSIESAAEKNGETINIAGISFTLAELRIMGDFYRFTKESGYSLHCIDERLEDDLGSLNNQVHEHCGACAASHAAIAEYLAPGLNVEDLLVKELGEDGKQSIYKQMEAHHASIAVAIDFSGDEAVVDPAKRSKLMSSKALAFQVSLPVNLIENFLTVRGNQDDEREMLLRTLVNWNVQIARNIIGGGHNSLQAQAGETIFIMDQRDVAGNPLVAELRRNISGVKHLSELVIED